MDFVIYSFGSGEALTQVFNAIALVIHGENGNILNGMIRVGSGISLSLVLVSLFQNQSLMPLLQKWLLPLFITVSGFFVPTTTVNIKDCVFPYHARVANVPLGLGLTASFFSHLSYNFTKIIESSFASVDDLSYHKSGSMFASNLMKSAQSRRITDENTLSNMREFVGQCVIPISMRGNKYTTHDLKNSPDVWGLIKEHASSATMVSYKEPPLKAEIITCKEAAEKLDKKLNVEVSKSFSFLQTKFFGGAPGSKMLGSTIKNLLPSAVEKLSSISNASAQELMRQMIMVPTIVEESDNISVSMGNASKLAARRAYLGQQSAWMTYGEMAKDLYPTLKAVLESLLYVLFIFLIPVSLIQMGFTAAFQWIRLIMWVNLWPPLYAVINAMSTYKAASGISLLSENGVTIANSAAVMSINSEWVATCGYLSLIGIPTLSWAIVSGAQMAITNLAGNLTGATQGFATSAANEALTGNYSYGNVQALNTSANMHSRGQSNFSPSFSAGSFRSSDGHVDQTLSGDGTMIANVARSNLPTSVNIADSMTGSLSDQYNSALTASNTQSEASSQSLMSAYRSAIDKGFHENQNRSMSDGYSHGDTYATQDSFGKTASAVEKFAKDHNISNQDATMIIAGVNAGLGKGALQKIVGIKADTQTTANVSDAISHAKDFSDQHQLGSSLNKSVSDARDLRFTETDDESRRYSQSIASSMDESDSFRRESAKSLSRADSLSHQLSYVKANSATINRDATQNVLEYVAAQPYAGSKGSMGMRQALNLAVNKPELFGKYAGRWVSENNGSFGGGGLPSEAALGASYNNQGISNSVGESAKRYESARNEAKLSDLNLDKGDIKMRYEDHKFTTDQQLEMQEQRLRRQEEDLRKNHAQQADRSTVMRAGENVGNNIGSVTSAAIDAGGDLLNKVLKKGGVQSQ
ncbi:MAG TPA: conjugal transfer protein TraG N-terminal domain-containing protein [Alphaproteobacteria bacterium]|nr:conjugal transfer protein TraG N-terminal domain-containing protein [Alphaproteobacteria bacterium]